MSRIIKIEARLPWWAEEQLELLEKEVGRELTNEEIGIWIIYASGYGDLAKEGKENV